MRNINNGGKSYSPFGMEMPGRGYLVENSYRYGFNGKENDKETLTQDYGMRIYDSRIAKFLSVDPLTKKYPELTPYQFASNRPIDGIDLDGLEWKEYDAKQNNVIIFPSKRDAVIEAEYQYALQAHMNVLISSSLGEINGYLQEKGRKYDNILFAGHGNWKSSSITMGDYGYKGEHLETYSKQLTELGSYLKEDGSIILLPCFQATPKYTQKNVPVGEEGKTVDIGLDGESLVKRLSQKVRHNVLANKGVTVVDRQPTLGGGHIFDGSLPQGLVMNEKKDEPYADVNNKYAGQWTLTLPNGKTINVGNIILNPDGTYKKTEQKPSNENGNNQNNKKVSPPAPGD